MTRLPELEPVPEVVRSKVWDLPVRIVHWAMAIALIVAWRSGEAREMELHRAAGLFVLGLLVFRLYWGIVGTSTARFAHFVRGPGTVARYLRGEHPPVAGHSPLGALSVVALFAALIAQVGLGLFAVDIDGLESGPLAALVSFDTGRTAAEWHELVFNILLALVLLHLAAIAFYELVKRKRLVGPMITGSRRYSEGDAPPARIAPFWLAAPGIVAAVAAIWGVSSVG